MTVHFGRSRNQAKTETETEFRSDSNTQTWFVHGLIKYLANVQLLFVGTAVHKYSLVWDNTQKLVKSRDQSRQSSNKMLMWANAYAARSRVPYTVAERRPTLPARDIPLSSYLPDANDMAMLRQRLAVIVSRMLVHHVSYFTHHCSSSPEQHIAHEYSAESVVKSQLVTTAFYTVSLYITKSL